MFSLFKKKIPCDSVFFCKETDPSNMTLAERKAWRLEMLKKSIYDVMSKLGIIGSMYRYRVMPIDDRGHHYVLMIDTTRDFALSSYSTTNKLIDIEIQLKKDTYNNYGVVIDSIYWKVSETFDFFNMSALKHPQHKPHKKTIAEISNNFFDTVPIGYIPHHDPEEDPVFEPFTDSQIQQYREKIAEGNTKRKIKIGGKGYETDFSPLTSD